MTARKSSRAGGVIVIAGPDGAGKSSLYEGLVAHFAGNMPVLRIHHRPSVLPARAVDPASMVRPHHQEPYGPAMSVLKTVYLFVDFVLGWILKVLPIVRRRGLVIIERGWWDLVVDQRRYRLEVPEKLLTTLGRLLPYPDASFILEAPAQVLLARKKELNEPELIRQMHAWRNLLPKELPRTYIDATRPLAEIVRLVESQLEPFIGKLEL